MTPFIGKLWNCEDIPGLSSLQPLFQGIHREDGAANLSFAVSGVLFKDESLVLMRRGPEARDERGKLEFVGGEAHANSTWGENLQREVQEELGGDVRIVIDGILCVQFQQFDPDECNIWCIVSCLCRLIAGIPVCNEPGKIDLICEMPVDCWYDLERSQLSRSTAMEREAYRMGYGSCTYWSAESLRKPVVYLDIFVSELNAQWKR